MKNTLLILLIIPSIVACKKLDLKPIQSQVVPQSLSDFQGLLDNANIINASYSILGEISADNYYLSTANYNALAALQHRNAYIWKKNTFEGVQLESGWNANYQRVFYSNIALDGLLKLSPQDQSENYKNIKGHALFTRGVSFFMVAQEFAPVYNISDDGAKPGIVLRLSSDLNIPSQRSSLKATYEQIIRDLEMAKELLPEKPFYKTRPCKAAAMAMLSRVYLSINEFQKSFENVDGALKTANSLIDYNTLVTTSSFPFPQLNAEVLMHATLVNTSILNPTNALIDPLLYDSYENNDLRQALFFRNNNNGTYSFKGNYNGSANPLFSGIAIDELYLTRAECHARLGRLEAALNDLNGLLITRFKAGTYVHKTAPSVDAALALIIAERRKELLLRGIRWMDLRRLNQDPRFAITLSRTVNGETYSLPPNDNRYTFPIPDYVIAINGIQQNP